MKHVTVWVLEISGPLFVIWRPVGQYAGFRSVLYGHHYLKCISSDVPKVQKLKISIQYHYLFLSSISPQVFLFSNIFIPVFSLEYIISK